MYSGARLLRSAISFLSLFHFAYHLHPQQPLALFTPLQVTSEIDQNTLSAPLHRQTTENSRVNLHFCDFLSSFLPIFHILQKDAHLNLWGLNLYVLRHPQEQLGASKDMTMLWRCVWEEGGGLFRFLCSYVHRRAHWMSEACSWWSCRYVVWSLMTGVDGIDEQGMSVEPSQQAIWDVTPT